MSAVDIFNLQPDKDLYDILKRATIKERQTLCEDKKYEAMCALIRFDERIQRNHGTMPVHTSDNTFKIVLTAFDDFTTGLALIEATHPGFIYTPQFKAYTQDFLKITTKSKGNLEKTIYTLGKYTYVNTKQDDKIFKEEWKLDGKRHRTDGPAEIEYYENGSIECQYWYIDGKLHRTDGPAWIGYYENGSIEWQGWYVNGKRHRTDGPAEIEYYENGSIEWQEWWIDGKKQ